MNLQTSEKNKKRTQPDAINLTLPETRRRRLDSGFISNSDVTEQDAVVPQETSRLNTVLVTPNNVVEKEAVVVPQATRSQRLKTVSTKTNKVADKVAAGTKKSNQARRKATTRPENQLSIEDFLIKPTSSQEVERNPEVSSIEDCIFGWASTGFDHIPFIIRNSVEYCALRMIEKSALAEYVKNSPIGSFESIFECYIPTKVQYKLLNEINAEHCDFQFGRGKFTSKDKLVRLSDVRKYAAFLRVCQKVHVTDENFGFTLINKKSYIPYTVLNGKKFIPLIYLQCDGDILDFLKSRSETISSDEAIYLKLCCKYDGVSVFVPIDVIDLAEIQKLAPPKTTFQDCWPTDQNCYQLRVVHKTKGLK